MNWKKRLALVMVFIFMLSWINGSANINFGRVIACTEPTYRVFYNGNGYTDGQVPSDDRGYEEDQRVYVLGPDTMEREHHEFAGWNDSPDGEGRDFTGSFKMPGHDVTLYAKWCEHSKYEVIYHGNGNTGGEAPEDSMSPYYEGEPVTVLGKGNLDKDNYNFIGWNTKADGTGVNFSPDDVFCMPGCEVNLYARWVENDKYALDYDGNGNTGGTVPVDGNSPYYAGTNVQILDPGDLEKEHHTFAAWNTMYDGSGTDYLPESYLSMPAENTTLYARWLEDPSYNVMYYGNGNDDGSAPTDSSSPYYTGENVTILGKADLAKDNHTFLGWNTAVDGSGNWYQESDSFIMDDHDVDLYAQWQENPKYGVTYHGNQHDSGDEPVDSASPYYEGSEVQVLGHGNLQKEHHSFTGWNTEAGGEGTSYTEGNVFIMGTNPVDLYAQWLEDPSYNVYYDGNQNDSGEPPTDNENPYYSGEEAIVLGANTIKRDHYHFGGWNTSETGDGDGYLPEDTIPIEDSDITLYAVWLQNEYTVTYHKGNHGNLEGIAVFPGLHYGDDTPPAPVVLPDYGYLFIGWDPVPTEKVSGDADYYAMYVLADDTIQLEKIPTFDGEEPLDVGAEVSYSFRITNLGNVTVKDIIITDPIVEIESIEPFDLTAGQSILIENAGSHVITESDSLVGFFYNEATAEGYTDELDRPTYASGAAQVLVKTAEPGLILEKSALTENTKSGAGDSVTYIFDVTNNGTVTLYDVYVDDQDIEFTSTRVTLAPGESHTWSLVNFYTVTEEDLFTGDIHNQATAYGWPLMAVYPVTSTDDAWVYLEEVNPVISVSKRVDDSHVEAGDTVLFSIVIKNEGNVTLSNIVIDDEFLEINENRTILIPGEEIRLSLPYTTTNDDVPGFENQVMVTGNVLYAPDTEVSDSDSVYVTVRDPGPPGPPNWTPAIDVEITASSENVEPDDEVTFTITVYNRGNTVLRNVEVECAELGFAIEIPTLYILGSQSFEIMKVMDASGEFDFIATAVGYSPQNTMVNDADEVTVTVAGDDTPSDVPDPDEPEEVPETPLVPPENPQPGDLPENPETGALPFDVYSVSALITLGAGIFALIKRKKEAEEDEDYDM